MGRMHSPLEDALEALETQTRVPLGLAPERRRNLRVAAADNSSLGQLFLEEIGPIERIARTHTNERNSRNHPNGTDRFGTSSHDLEDSIRAYRDLDESARAYRVVEVVEVGGETISEEILGEVWLSVRDSDLAGLLPTFRQVHVRVRFDRLGEAAIRELGDDLLSFVEQRANAACADNVVVSTTDSRMLQVLGSRGYLDDVVRSTRKSDGASVWHAHRSIEDVSSSDS